MIRGLEKRNAIPMRKYRTEEDSAGCKFQVKWKNVKPQRPFDKPNRTASCRHAHAYVNRHAIAVHTRGRIKERLFEICKLLFPSAETYLPVIPMIYALHIYRRLISKEFQLWSREAATRSRFVSDCDLLTTARVCRKVK